MKSMSLQMGQPRKTPNRHVNRDAELQQVRRDLEVAQARYAGLYDGAPIGYADVSMDLVILQANPHTAALLGMERKALVGREMKHFVTPEYRPLCEARHGRLIETGETQLFELRMVKEDGTPFWARLRSNLAADNDGAPICRIILMNISARRQMETELRQMARAVEQAPASVVITDREGNIEYVNGSITFSPRSHESGDIPRPHRTGV